MKPLRRLLTFENALNLLLVFLPVALALQWMHGSPVAVFLASAVAIVPLAGLMGKATEHLAEQMGEGLGGLLNATFGNAAELIIALMALRAGLHDVVKASLTGSIIGNLLLVLGLVALVGGLRAESLRFNRTAASVSTTLLALAAIGLVIPAIFHRAATERSGLHELELSTEIAVVLFATYLLSLVFTLRTHAHLYVGAAHESEAALGVAAWSRGKSLAVLLAATAGVAVMSELLVRSIEHAALSLGMTQVFVGVILVAIIGNAAEHSTAVLVARKGKGDLAVNIAVGSSLQIALFVAPFLVFASYVVGSRPMDLVFTPFEVMAVALSVLVVNMIGSDGEVNWMEGVMLLAVYLILGLAFYFLPA